MAVSLEQFSRQLAESGVLSEQDLRAFLDKLPAAEKPSDGEQLAKRLVKEKQLSAYQAQAVYSGKGKTLTMGSYFVLDKLGQGGMGMVLKAEHRMMKRMVAIKVLSPSVTKTKELAQRFQREVEAAARLTHPNIVGAFDAGETNGSPFLVMEYVPGDDLASVVKKKGPLSVDQAIDCIAQAAKGLEFAHSQGVIHRDIKPANLLMDTKGVVKILDMGLARIEATDVATQADLTGTGAVMGTVDYMAPEQALSTKHADARSDLYSLGISLWYLLTGKPAYEGDSLMARLLAHREHPIPSLRSVRGDVPESVDHLFEKLVAKKQADRYQTATDLLVDLQACRSGASIKAVTVAEVATGPDEFQNFLQHIEAPTEGPRGGRSNPSMTGTKTVARSLASVTTADETMSSAPVSETQRFRRPKIQKAKSPPWFQDRRVQIGGAAAAVLVLLAVFLFQTPSGTLRVEILDPEVEMTVKGTNLKFHGSDLDPVSLKVGEKKLLVTRGDLTFPTESFEIKKGKETRIKVELVGDKLVVNSGGKMIGEQSIRRKTLTTSTTEINRPGTSAPTTSVSEIASSGAPAESKFALQFDGTGLVEVDNIPMLPSVVCTLEMWVTPEAFPIDFSRLVIFEDDQRALILHSQKKYRFYTFHNEAVMNDEAKLKQRVHLAGVNDGSERRLYLNGKLVGQKNEPGQMSPTPKNTKRLGIGSGFSGTIDGVRISSSARYDRDFVPETDWKADDATEALYLFNEEQGDVLKDLSRHGRPGRIKGAKWVRLEGRPPGSSNMPDGGQAPKPAVAPFDVAQARKHQEAWATYLNVPVEFTNSIGMKFRLIPPGEFTMGITPEQLEAFRKIVPDEDGKAHLSLRSAMPGHRVRLTRPIYMQVDQVRLSQYTSLLGREPANAELDRNDYLWRGVNWHDAIEFCNKLGESEKRPAMYTLEGTETRLVPGVAGYRLPTEAEFEFACRAGTDTFFYFGNDGAKIMDHVRNHALEHVQANPFGLIELYGSTTNWCWDATPQDINSYPAELLKQANDPIGIDGPNRITRGGLYFAGGGGDAVQNNSYRRNSVPPDLRGSAGLGRIVLMIGERPATSLSKPADEKSSWQTWPVDAPPPAIAPFDAAQAKKHQEAWAAYLKRPVEFTNSLGMKFTLIPPGEFLMGCDKEEIARQKLQLPPEDDRAVFAINASASVPKHAVRITRPFYMQTHEITNGLYQTLLGNLPAGNDPAETDSPVLKNVSLGEAAAFCDAISKKEGKIPAYRTINGKTTRVLTANGYRLPTEAEWEYACRAGTTTFWFFGDVAKSDDLFDYQTIRRGSAVKPNPFGLIDMYGGSSEWCFDHLSPYPMGTVVDPFTEPEGEAGVARGGSMFAGGGGDVGTINSVIRAPLRGFGFDKFWFGLGRVVLPIEWNPAVAPPPPAAVTPPTTGKLFMHDPAFRQWMKDVQAMPAEQQVEAVRKKLVELNPKFDGKLVTTRSGHGGSKIEEGKVTEFGFYTDEVTDISPVAALQDLTHLFCACNAYEMKGARLKDLSPLRGMRLKSLDLFYNTTLSDLTHLQGMPLTSLVIAGTKPVTLASLEGMKLTNLNLAATPVKNLTLLKGMPLTDLNLAGTPVEDLTPLKGMPLKTLVMRESQVSDLSPITGMSLTHLDILGCTRISDASPLRGMKLEILSCLNTQISDYSFLTGMPLKNVEFNFKADRDADILRSIKTLEHINGKTVADFWKEVGK
ncbi:MAG: SUMF1/EgtB/PvdO family nonheme iron enzyme [Planctomycetaceae bacterium]